MTKMDSCLRRNDKRRTPSKEEAKRFGCPPSHEAMAGRCVNRNIGNTLYRLHG